MTTPPNFDEIIDRRGTGCAKWDAMEKLYGVSPDEGLAMWVADMDFRPPQCVLDRGRALLDMGVYGYTTGDGGLYDAVSWWMGERHGWTVAPEAMFTTTGIVNAVALCLETFTAPGDGIVLFTPVYHAFAKTILGADRKVVECQMPLVDGIYTMDFDAWDAQMTGSEKMIILCSPHNPGGRVWTREELEGIAAFAKRHDMLLVSDEIHHDLIMPGQKHIPMALIEECKDRLITLAAPSKTFNLAGLHTGCVIIEDDDLRARFAKRKEALRVSSNLFGVEFATAAYSPDGAAWVDALTSYLEGNRKVFDDGINAIPGVTSMPLQATYLSWVDFAGTGMTLDEIKDRVYGTAKIAANEGPAFGTGGESFIRFNIGMPRAKIEEAVERMANAFADLQ